jgi:cytochrome c-type biogenesis protein
MPIETGPGLWVLAFLAGLISFTSPCVLPLLPGYLSFVTGLQYGAVGKPGERLSALGPCVLFVVGFTLIFTALGASASALGDVLRAYRLWLEDAAGVFILAMALLMSGLVRIPWLMRDYGLHMERRPSGILGACVLGMAFAIGWTPCVGPVLAAVLAVAGSEGTATSGALLLLVYSAGLGVPFIVSGLYLAHLTKVFGAMKRHMRYVTYVGSATLALMGILLIAHRWTQFMAPLLRLYANLNWPPL